MPLEIRYADVGNSSDGSVCGATVTNLPFISSMSADETSSKCTYDSPAQHQGEYRGIGHLSDQPAIRARRVPNHLRGGQPKKGQHTRICSAFSVTSALVGRYLF